MTRTADLTELRRVGQRHQNVRAQLTELEAQRDRLIRDVYARGNVTHNEIADAVGVSFQRVSQILAKD